MLSARIAQWRHSVLAILEAACSCFCAVIYLALGPSNFFVACTLTFYVIVAEHTLIYFTPAFAKRDRCTLQLFCPVGLQDKRLFLQDVDIIC